MIAASGRPVRPPFSFLRFLLLAALSVVLMFFDHQGQHLQRLRSGVAVLTYPLVVIAAMPARLGKWTTEVFTSEQTLRERNEQMREEQMQLLSRLEQYEALDAENKRLRELLGSATKVADRAMVVELLEVSPEPFTRKIVLAKGRRHAVYLGQPVIDAYGVVGQVTEVNPGSSRATLITDPGHAIPVQVNRNGLRAIAYGIGADDRLDVPFQTISADIKVGDLLTTSGMGGRFPPRYPVATVKEIKHDPNEAFLKITAAPLARLSHDKEVLLIWPGIPPEKEVQQP